MCGSLSESIGMTLRSLTADDLMRTTADLANAHPTQARTRERENDAYQTVGPSSQTIWLVLRDYIRRAHHVLPHIVPCHSLACLGECHASRRLLELDEPVARIAGFARWADDARLVDLGKSCLRQVI
jgi:hypothetical protein